MINRNNLILYLICLLAAGMVFADHASAVTAKEKYLQADRYYRWLKKNTKIQKYRDKWLVGIEKYQAVYRHDPNGPWAAAGMFRSGEVYYELFQRSYKKSDRAEALDIFERIIKRYPKSQYRKRLKPPSDLFGKRNLERM